MKMPTNLNTAFVVMTLTFDLENILAVATYMTT